MMENSPKAVKGKEGRTASIVTLHSEACGRQVGCQRTRAKKNQNHVILR